MRPMWSVFEAYGDHREARGLTAVYAKVAYWSENFETHKNRVQRAVHQWQSVRGYYDT